MKENSLKKIIRKTGRKPVICKCEACRKQCHTPCLGTPEDILRLIKAGYLEKLAVTFWCVGMITGEMDYPIVMVQATRGDTGYCVFYHDGLCELHDKQLKPTEGRLSHHSITQENYVFRKGLSYNVAKEWLDKENIAVIRQVFCHLCESAYTI